MLGAVGLRRGTIKATVLIETIPAAFEMNEILYELRVRCGTASRFFAAVEEIMALD